MRMKIISLLRNNKVNLNSFFVCSYREEEQ